ncbi:MAG: winged helix-turn-helix transcriptional regulator [Candidatus Aenigmarchaeota archaeon]|nr:winged helix-turn-helix transcriptional regulator [Candidatus Aenigmarchaeota archaeon]
MVYYDSNIKRLMWYIFAGMRGGPTRIRILTLLSQRPCNMNQIKKDLTLDYKTVQHHIKLLEENRLVTSEEKRYGTVYFTSQIFEQNRKVFEEIQEKIKE